MITVLLAGLIFCAVALGVAVCLRRFARRLADAEWLDTQDGPTDDELKAYAAGAEPRNPYLGGNHRPAARFETDYDTQGGPQ